MNSNYKRIRNTTLDNIDRLSPQEQLVLKLRYGLDGHDRHTYKQIGEHINKTYVRAQQIEKCALTKLKLMWEQADVDPDKVVQPNAKRVRQPKVVERKYVVYPVCATVERHALYNQIKDCYTPWIDYTNPSINSYCITPLIAMTSLCYGTDLKVMRFNNGFVIKRNKDFMILFVTRCIRDASIEKNVNHVKAEYGVDNLLRCVKMSCGMLSCRSDMDKLYAEIYATFGMEFNPSKLIKRWNGVINRRNIQRAKREAEQAEQEEKTRLRAMRIRTEQITHYNAQLAQRNRERTHMLSILKKCINELDYNLSINTADSYIAVILTLDDGSRVSLIYKHVNTYVSQYDQYNWFNNFGQPKALINYSCCTDRDIVPADIESNINLIKQRLIEPMNIKTIQQTMEGN